MSDHQRDVETGANPELAALRATIEDLASRNAELVDRLDELTARLGGGSGTVVEQLQDQLADVASGEVVGALWEEVREVRAALPTGAGGVDDELRESIAALRAEVEGIGAAVAAGTEPTADPAVAGLRNDVHALADEIRAVLESVAMEAEPGAVDDRIGPLADELATLRAELAEGLVVEPSDALSASLDALKAEVDGLRDALAELRNAERPAEPAPVAPPADALVSDELQSIRSALDGIQARLDEGLVLAEDSVSPASPGADVEGVADQVAAMRDFVASELDGLRESVRASAPTEVQATVDPATVELLRDEIRAAGGVADQVVDALRDEIKALRRRLAVKAAERVLDDQQLAQIADAVAARLASE